MSAPHENWRAASFKNEPISFVTTNPRTNKIITASPPCGKICSYSWDAKEEGKYYPLLHKSVNCSNILHRMAYSPGTVILPPPRRPPPNLINNFTMDGQCPITVFRYYNNFGDKKPNDGHFSATAFDRLLRKDSVTNINGYRDKNVLKPALKKYKQKIYDKSVAVIGTRKPWAEAILLNLGAKHVTTVEYAKLIIEHKRVTTVTPDRLATRFISGQAVLFDTVFTYSSIEHSGLGRYGDPVAPFGDLEATAQVWCMVKPGGYFILAVPMLKDQNKCSVKWNGGRRYGTVRLQHLTANWHVLDDFKTHDLFNQHIFVLKKIP